MYTVELHDRPGALERLLGICRRRAFKLTELQARLEAGRWTLTLVLGEGAPPITRVLPLLSRDHDVISVLPVDPGVAGSVRRIA